MIDLPHQPPACGYGLARSGRRYLGVTPDGVGDLFQGKAGLDFWGGAAQPDAAQFPVALASYGTVFCQSSVEAEGHDGMVWPTPSRRIHWMATTQRRETQSEQGSMDQRPASPSHVPRASKTLENPRKRASVDRSKTWPLSLSGCELALVWKGPARAS